MKTVKETLKARRLRPGDGPGLAEGIWSVSGAGHEWVTNPEVVGTYQDRRVSAMGWSNKPALEWTNQSPPDWHKSDDWIMESVPLTPSQREYKRYDPLKAKDLLHRFVSIPHKLKQVKETKRAILEFANEFGLLGANQALVNTQAGTMDCERLQYWRSRVFHLKVLVEIHRLLSDPSEEAEARLKEMVPIGPFEMLHIKDVEVEEIERHLFEAPMLNFNRFEEPTPNIRQTAYGLLSTHVNDALEHWTRVHIELVEGAPIVLIPLNLMGALYLSFAMEAIGKNPSYRQCKAPGCNKLVSNPDVRAMYCSSQCKERAKMANRRARARKENENE